MPEQRQRACGDRGCTEPAYRCDGCDAEGCMHGLRKACRCEDGPDPSPLYDDPAPSSAIDFDAVQARFRDAACEAGDSDSWRSAKDVPALLARVRELENEVAGMRERDAINDAMMALFDSEKEEHSQRAKAVDRFRGQACYAASVAKRLFPALDTHGEDGWPRDKVITNAFAAEVERLRTVAGRTTAPTDAEIGAHRAAGGAWLVRAEWLAGRQSIDFVQSWAPQMAKVVRDHNNATWWMPLDSTHMPCAWPDGRAT